MKKNKLFTISLVPLVLFSSCNKKQSNVFKCIKDEQFGSIYFDCSIEDFNKRGFTFGDSLTFKFYDKEGKITYTKEDVPYYNGYYGWTNDLVVCGYKGYISPAIARCQGSSTYEEFEIDENTKVEFTLYEKEKYLPIQKALNLSYSDDIEHYKNDKVRFANFYSLNGEKIKQNLFYRSASPCDNAHKRAPYVNELLQTNNIAYSINISDSKEEYDDFKKKESFLESSYYNSLVENGNVDFLNLGVGYQTQSYCNSVASSFKKLLVKKPTKIHFHCQEGKDRTGFMSALILSVAGESSDVIIQDYMKTYYNYYGITEKSEQYLFITYLKVYDFILYFKSLDTQGNNLKVGARKYLENGGMRVDEIDSFVNFISLSE